MIWLSNHMAWINPQNQSIGHFGHVDLYQPTYKYRIHRTYIPWDMDGMDAAWEDLERPKIDPLGRKQTQWGLTSHMNTQWTWIWTYMYVFIYIYLFIIKIIYLSDCFEQKMAATTLFSWVSEKSLWRPTEDTHAYTVYTREGKGRELHEKKKRCAQNSWRFDKRNDLCQDWRRSHSCRVLSAFTTTRVAPMQRKAMAGVSLFFPGLARPRGTGEPAGPALVFQLTWF